MPAASLTFSCQCDLRKLVLSHGWVHLAPFAYSDQQNELHRPLRIGTAIVPFRIRQHQSVITARCSQLTRPQRSLARMKIQRMLRLDEDLTPFHEVCKDDAGLRFVHENRCGSMLRAPTLFEDIIKTVCTTNCDWRNTKRMCERLCELGGGDFPTPDQVLSITERELGEKTSSGYRSRTFQIVASLMLEEKLPLDEWAAEREFDRIHAALKPVWGIGSYSRTHIAMLLGDYREIPVDCEILRYLRNTHFNGRKVSTQRAVKPYEKFGEFKYLAYKFGRMSRRENYINKP